MSWPDWFGFPIFNSVDWEMRERQREQLWLGQNIETREQKKNTETRRGIIKHLLKYLISQYVE